MARLLAARTGWVLVAVALGVVTWLDHGDGPFGYVWRPAVLGVGIVAAVVAAPTSTGRRLAGVALAATVLRIGMLPIEVRNGQ